MAFMEKNSDPRMGVYVWKDKIMAYLRVLSHPLPGGAEEKYRKWQ
jgi:hypothetical protein